MSAAGSLTQPVTAQIKLVSLTTTPAAIQRVLESLQAEAPADLIALLGVVGEPPLPHRAEAVITQWPPFLDNCHPAAITALALLAEQDGAWRSASRAWAHLGERTRTASPSDAAGAYVLAAVAAKLEDDIVEHARLLKVAREIDPAEPRIVLEEIHDEASAQQRIDACIGLHSADPAVEALIKSNLAIGQVLLPDIDAAERTLADLPAEARDSMPVRAARLNVAVQRARLATLDQRPVNGSELRRLKEDALTLRDELLAQRRFGESGRLLMLAVDASALLGQRAAASKALAARRPEELAGSGAEVLAAVALRIGAWRAVIDIADAAPRQPPLQRLRAAAAIEAGTAAEADEAIAYLDLVVSSGQEGALEAAFLRLAAVIRDGSHFAWSVAASDLAIAEGHERIAIIAKSFELAHRHADYEGAYELLDGYSSHEWARSMKLRLAHRHGNHSALREAANAVLEAGPSQELRVECGQALARTGDFEDAVRALAGLTQEMDAPPGPRAQALYLVVRILGPELDRWEDAARYHDQWSRAFPGDTRASGFAPMIAHRTKRD